MSDADQQFYLEDTKEAKVKGNREKSHDSVIRGGIGFDLELEDCFADSHAPKIEVEPAQMRMDIMIKNFGILSQGKYLFHKANLTLLNGRRYGLVGGTGFARTTLLNYIGTRKLAIPCHIDLLYCGQEVDDSSASAIDTVLLSNENGDGRAADRLKEVIEDLGKIGSNGAESRARQILSGLGFSQAMQEMPCTDFSGGWLWRISLARALLLEPTLLMLDEPTNHLDLNAVVWLAEYLQSWNKTLLVVSNDRGFLDSVCTDIIFIANQKLYEYSGNYSFFKKSYQQNLKVHKKALDEKKQLKDVKKEGKSSNQAEEQIKQQQRNGVILDSQGIPEKSTLDDVRKIVESNNNSYNPTNFYTVRNGTIAAMTKFVFPPKHDIYFTQDRCWSSCVACRFSKTSLDLNYFTREVTFDKSKELVQLKERFSNESLISRRRRKLRSKMIVEYWYDKNYEYFSMNSEMGEYSEKEEV